MPAPSKKHIKKVVLLFVMGFLALFTFRLVYGYRSVPVPGPFMENSIPQAVGTEHRKNYASIKYQGNQSPTSGQIDQKYEKIADIASHSSQFTDHENELRESIKTYEGLIQFENKNGNDGRRNLKLVIGVPPENFDRLYASLTTIGTVQSKQITKKDKTNEYKELNAKKASLEKIRASLIGLKAKGGRIDEYMQLENRILEIEQQLQELGVSLGNFDDENEFCTVKFTLNETKALKIGILQRVKTALEWTIETYLMLMALFTFILLAAYIGLLTIQKLRTLLHRN